MSYMVMTNQTYSLKQLARLIYPAVPEHELEQFMRKVRHWTACDLLQPVDGKKTGTGVSRRYSVEEVRRAAILAEIARYRVPVPVIGDFALAMDNYQDRAEWKTALKGKESILLQFAWNKDFTNWGLNKNEPNLFALTSMGKERDDIDPFSLASAITINLTKVFARLAV